MTSRASARQVPGKYRFGPFAFGSKKAVYEHARLVRERYRARQPITAPDDLAFVADVFRCNAEGEEKGQDVAAFFWARSPDHPTPCFWIRRSDGSETDFGLGACLAGIGRLNRAALRAAVQDQIDTYRTTRLMLGATTFVSDFSNVSFPVDEAEVDHVTPFNEIVDQFFGLLGIDLDEALLTAAVDGRSEPIWRDPELIAAFAEFHRGFPLRLVHGRENQSDIRRISRPAAQPAR